MLLINGLQTCVIYFNVEYLPE